MSPRIGIGAPRCYVVLVAAARAARAAGSPRRRRNHQPRSRRPNTTPLRAYARRNVFVGSAIDRGFRYAGSDGVTFRSAMARQFNMLTAENDMKHDRIHPARDTYRFEPADSLVTFAESNGMRVRGHTLVFHNQLASWLTSGTWTKDEAKALLADHITRSLPLPWARRRMGRRQRSPGDNGALRSGFWLDDWP
jgi:endo-1,4-beta-xylanase